MSFKSDVSILGLSACPKNKDWIVVISSGTVVIYIDSTKLHRLPDIPSEQFDSDTIFEMETLVSFPNNRVKIIRGVLWDPHTVKRVLIWGENEAGNHSFI
jgi:hypothetical protein